MLISGADPGFYKGGFFYMQGWCQRQCTEAHSADQSAPTAEIFFAFRMDSCGTFVLCIASSRCKRIAGPGAAMCFHFLLKFRSCNVPYVIRTYT